MQECAVEGVRLLLPHPNPDYSGIVFEEFANCLLPKPHRPVRSLITFEKTCEWA
jgi:hypothetical protein